VGDVFDTARVSDETLAWTADQLDRLDRPTVVLPGNHDLWGPSSVYARFDFEAACPQVRVITEPAGEVVHLAPLDLACWGRPVMDHAPTFRPLADPPPRPSARFCVALGHGLLLEDDGPTQRGSPILPSDLEAITWDYVALGHWSTFWLVRSGPSPVCYAGPTARHADWAPGAVLVDFIPGAETVVRRLALDVEP
jgi:DNA repair exonuclease SbcCD nuclease subunit